jgi:hypothetical protein
MLRMVFSIDLDNRHKKERDLLEACVRDGVLAFNLHTHAEAHVKNVRVFSDEVDVYLGPVTAPQLAKVTKVT